MTRSKVYLDEIFLSLQGEAGETGVPQLFLRLAGCPLRCTYCDTPRTWERTPDYRRHEAGGTVRAPNPLDAPALESELRKVAASHGADPVALTLSVTGGEPLEQADFLEDWLPRWEGRVLLETAGLWPDRLERLLPEVDVVSLDWKLDGSLRCGHELTEPAVCARLFGESGSEGWVKLVVAEDTGTDDLGEALSRLAAEAPGVRAYLQPVTRFGTGPGPPTADTLLAWSLQFRDLPLDLRVQPQMHPVIGCR